MISFRVFFSNLIKHLVDFSLNAVLYIHRIPVFSVIIKGLLKLFNPHKDILMTLEGHKIYVNTIDRMMAVTFWKFSYSESYERRFLKDFLWEGMCVVDVGANLGYHTLQLAKCVGPNGKVYAFEPDPGNYRLLVKNVETNGYHNVIPVQKAVCDKPGSISLFVCEENRGDNRMFNSHDGRKAIEVESVSLDQFLGHIQVPIDLIKIDTQGAEFLVLSGMEELIKRNPKLMIICEFVPYLLAKCGSSAKELLLKIRNLGLHIYVINAGDNRLEPVEDENLIARYAVGNRYTNLFLKKG